MSSLSFKLHSLWNHTFESNTTTPLTYSPPSISKPKRKCIKQRRQLHRKWFKIKKSIQLSSALFMIILIIIFDNNKNVYWCDAVPISSSVSSSISSTDKLINISNTGEVALKRIASDTINRVGNLSRHHTGDVFNAYDLETCDTDTCVGMSSGTADIFKNENREFDTKLSSRTTSTSKTAHECKCQCLPHLQTYREDLSICVDDIHECTLAPFVSGSSSEKIPFVFLPLRGQIIHPSKEISFQGVKTPICAVSSSQYLTQTGWTELRNPSDTDVPFRLFRDEGRTFLQWLGEPDLRYRMQGRLILVHLMCRDIIPSVPSAPEELENDYLSSDKADVKVPNIFQHCVAFRVYGTPIKHINNVTEVSFQSEIQSNVPTTTNGLSTKEYIAIGACSILLGLIYVASVFLYIHVKKRKSSRNSSINDINNGVGVGGVGGNNSSGNNSNSSIIGGLDDSITTTTKSMNNDQITYGPPFNRNNTNNNNGGSYRNGRNLIDRQGSYRNGNGSSSSGGGNELNGEEIGIIKNNPLLKHYPNLSNDNSGFLSDFSNSNSECEDECLNSDIKKNMQSSVILHPNGLREMIERRQYHHQDVNNHQQQSMNNQESECLPEENVSITEDMSPDDKLENMKAIVNGTIRRKLYFNPAYFEPHLLLSPPPAAVEFLTKIREVITIAKYKMATKRFQPSLIVIPEEKNKISELYSTKSSIKINNNNNNNNKNINNNSNIDDSILNTNTTNNNNNNNDLHEQTKCSGCSNCVQISDNNNDISDSNNNNNNNGNNNNKTTNNCKNCGDKRNSIHKWLEDVTNHGNEHDLFDEDDELKKINVDNDENSKTITGTTIINGTNELTDKSITDSVQKNDSNNSSCSGSPDQDTSSDTTAKGNSNSLKSSSNKRKAPPIPTTAPPKIISHFLKQKPIINPKESLKIPTSIKNPILSPKPLSSAAITDDHRTNSFEIENEIHNNNNNNSLYIKNSTKLYTNKNDIYNNAASTQHRILSSTTNGNGNELYNNPQFQIIGDHHDNNNNNNNHSSSTLSIQRRKMNNPVNYNEDGNNSMQKLRQSKKSSKLDVFDQYTNNSSPTTAALNLQHQNQNDITKNMPNDMIYDGLSIKDYSSMDDGTLLLLNRPSDDNSSYSFSLPTPDYDDLYSTYSKQHNNKYGYNNMENVFVPVPTPDYNTYGRSGGGSVSGGRKQHQPPDSPIYSRKSPHHLIVDYETDSLERSTINKKYINNNNNNGTLSSTSSSRHGGSSSHMASLKKPIAAKKQFLPQSNINGTSSPTQQQQPPSLSSIMARDTKQSIKSATTTTTTDSSITNSDLSSQPSPSLSVALPLEEEVEIGNTIYGRRDDFRRPTNNNNNNETTNATVKEYSKLLAKNKQLTSKSSTYDEIYINKNLFEPTEPLIKYNTPFHGSMTIEVKHNPIDCEISTAEDSDQFEPDTLDRKPKNKQQLLLLGANKTLQNSINGKYDYDDENILMDKQKNLDSSPWSHDTFFNRFNDKLRYSSLENMTSLPEMSNFLGITDSPTNTNKKTMNTNGNNNNSNSCTNTIGNNRLILRSNGSFKCSSSINNISDLGIYGGNNGPNLQRNFGSLREIYEAKNQQRTNLKNAQSISNNSINFLDDKGRLLTLEARHSKRQRQTNNGTTHSIQQKQQNCILPPSLSLAGSDIIPFDLNSLKSNASKGSNKASSAGRNQKTIKNNQTNQKNLMGWNTNNNNSNNNGSIYQEHQQQLHQKNTDYDTYYTTANEIIIGRSDTEKNSDLYSSIKQFNNSSPHQHQHHHHHHHRHHHHPNHHNLHHHQHNNNNNESNSHLVSQLRKSNSMNGFSNRKRSDIMINVNNSYHNYNNRPLNKSIKPPKRPPPPPPADGSIAAIVPIQILENHMSFGNDDLNKIEILKSSRSINKHKHLRTLADYDNLYDVDDDDDDDLNRFDPNCSLSSTDSANSSSNNNNNNNTGSSCSNSSNCSNNSINNTTNGQVSKIFRVDVNPTTHGMQIALGIKDRVKKSKDLKNAWKRFVSLATSKFINQPTAQTPDNNQIHNNNNNNNNGKIKRNLDYFEKISNQSDSLDGKDEGISSLIIDENIIILEGGNNIRTSQKHDDDDDEDDGDEKQSIICNNNNNNNNNKGKLSRNSSINSTSENNSNIINNSSSNNNNTIIINNNGNNMNAIKRSELDGGYMSADSNESKLNSKKLYERFNFNYNKFRRRSTAPINNSGLSNNNNNNNNDDVNNEIKNNYNFMQKIKEGTELITDKFSFSNRQQSSLNGNLPNEKLKSSKKQNFPTNNDCKMKIINENDILPSEFMSKNFILQIQNLYSSSDDDDNDNGDDDNDDDDVGDDHDECRSDRDDATDDDEFNNLDDICESGAESIETNSVFFKNIRKLNKE